MRNLKVAPLLILTTAAIGITVMLGTGCTKATKATKAATPAQSGKAVTKEPAAKQVAIGDPYPLDTCPVSEEELGSMGEPIIYSHNGREIRFCCNGCIDDFEADPGKYLKKIDAKIIEAQLPSYPTDTCLVSGEKFGGEMGEPINYVHNNRLVRFCCKGCIKDFKADPDKYMAKLT